MKKIYKELKKKYPNGIIHGIVAGHGGIVDGKYNILKKGTKQIKFPDGKIIYEGVENRKIKNAIFNLMAAKYLYSSIYTELIDPIPGNVDFPLKTRIEKINDLFDYYKSQGKLLLIWEIHLNAFNGQVEGKEIYTTTKNNFSDEMATIWWNNAEKICPEQKDRPDNSDGDPDKEKDYSIIKNIKTFGVLSECFFFDNRKEVDLYCNEKGYNKWAEIFISSFIEINKNFKEA